jgi:hypothetical protein
LRIKNDFSPTTVKKVFAFLISALSLVLFTPISAQASGPSLQSAVVDYYQGRYILLTFDDLSGNILNPRSSDFSVSGSVQGTIGVASSIRLGNSIRVSLAATVLGNQTSSITYSPTTNVPTNSANEPLAGFTTQVANPGAIVEPSYQNAAFNDTNLAQIRLSSEGLTSTSCSLTTSNFSIKVNGSQRSITSVVQNCGIDSITVNLSSPVAANDSVSISYFPTSNSIVSVFGTPAAAFTDLRVGGVPDTIAPMITVPSVSNFLFGQGGNIALNSNETGTWQVTTDRTLSFQIYGTPPQLLVSSILPVGTYTVGLTATDDAGNTTTRNISVNILAAGATPSPTPSVTATPLPNVSKAVVYKTCALLIRKYPGGVAQSYKVRNKGASMSRIPYVDSAIYKANIKLDTDKDGIACER